MDSTSCVVGWIETQICPFPSEDNTLQSSLKEISSYCNDLELSSFPFYVPNILLEKLLKLGNIIF